MPFILNNRGFVKITNSLIVIVFFVFLISCSGRQNGDRTFSIREVYKPDTLSLLIKYESSLFPLPSPYQATHLIKQHEIPFYDDIPNKTENVSRYTTAFKKALNLGIYGTGLSYLNIYERTPQTILYLGVIKRLADELGLAPAFDNSFFESVERNMNVKDSLMVLMGITFRRADTYLKENDRNEIGALILAGGWVESLYILTRLAKATSNRDIINRIGEQKHPLDNLIEVLSPFYYRSEEYSELIDKFVDLAYEFDGIIYSYSYKDPSIDVDNKIIHINSQSRVVISDYHLDIISQKLEEIRNLIIQ